MSIASSSVNCAATGWSVSRQWMRSVPRSSTPAGSVPGSRLATVHTALRAAPGATRIGQVTKPGRNGRRGSSARHATSAPATTDWRRKRASARSNALGDRRHAPAGRSLRLVHVAATTATVPAGSPAGSAPDRTSHNAVNQAARVAVAGSEPAGKPYWLLTECAPAKYEGLDGECQAPSAGSSSA
jgi:hypothetical protein